MGTAVWVGVGVAVCVATRVAVAVRVAVAGFDGPTVGQTVAVGDGVAVDVGVGDGVTVAVCVGVAVLVGVLVGAPTWNWSLKVHVTVSLGPTVILERTPPVGPAVPASGVGPIEPGEKTTQVALVRFQ